MTTKLQDWSIRSDPYQAPEVRGVYVAGTRPDGKTIVSSRIIGIDGRKLHTESGSVYVLGRIRPSYRRWLAGKGIEYNPRQPVRFIGGSNGDR